MRLIGALNTKPKHGKFKRSLDCFKTSLLTKARSVNIRCPPFQYLEKSLPHEIHHVRAIQASVTRDVAERTFWDSEPRRSIRIASEANGMFMWGNVAEWAGFDGELVFAAGQKAFYTDSKPYFAYDKNP